MAANQQNKSIYVSYSGGITDESVPLLLQAFNNLVAEKKPDELYFQISTPGGGVNAGIVLYNFLRALPVKLTTHNIGQVDSIGTVVFLAGDQRYMAPATSFLFHGVAMNGKGEFRFTKPQLNEVMSQFDQDERRIEEIVCDRSSLPSRRLRELYNNGESLGAEDALKFGIVSEVRVPAIPSGAETYVLTLSVPTK